LDRAEIVHQLQKQLGPEVLRFDNPERSGAL
jgi:hypothetical protein